MGKQHLNALAALTRLLKGGRARQGACDLSCMLIDATRDLAARRVGTALCLQLARTAVKGAAPVDAGGVGDFEDLMQCNAWRRSTRPRASGSAPAAVATVLTGLGCAPSLSATPSSAAMCNFGRPQHLRDIWETSITDCSPRTGYRRVVHLGAGPAPRCNPAADLWVLSEGLCTETFHRSR